MTDLLLNRRRLFTSGLALLAASILPWRARAEFKGPEDTTGYVFEVTRTEDAWRAMLTEEEYRILRKGGTEKPKSSPLWEETRAGIYHCKGCDLAVYDGEWKEVLDRGWVFFFHAIPHAVMTNIDGIPERYIDGKDFAIVSTIETHCRRCGSHLGHIFNVKGNLLHCINGASLVFKPDEAA